MVDESGCGFCNQVTLGGVITEVPVGRVMSNGKREYVGSIMCANESDAPTDVPRLEWDWFRIVLYGRLGDQASEVMERGILLRIVGRLSTRGMQVGPFGDHNSLVIEVTEFTLLEESARKRPFSAEFGPLRT